jgi:hypothetical protein
MIISAADESSALRAGNIKGKPLVIDYMRELVYLFGYLGGQISINIPALPF